MQGKVNMVMGRVASVALVCVLPILCAPRPVAAQLQLTDLNSTANIVTNSQAGMNSWTIDNTGVLDQQWFWYRVNGDPTGQHSLDTLPSTYTLLASNHVSATFTGNGFNVGLDFLLTGTSPGSGNTDMSEVFSIHNTSSSNLVFHFFEYSNFVLGTPGSDTVNFPWSNSVVQVGSIGSVSETNVSVVTGLPGFVAPMHHEANVFANTLNSLNQGSPYTLNDVNSAGPGDVTWAFQWDAFNLQPTATALISKDINVQVPEPSTVVLVGLGLLGGLALRRRRS